MNRRKEYQKYLKSAHWKSLRKRAIQKYGKICDICQIKPKFVHVHHLKYTQDLKDVTLEMLRVLCKDCHDYLHLIIKTEKIKDYQLLKNKIKLLINNQDHISKEINKKSQEIEIIKLTNKQRRKTNRQTRLLNKTDQILKNFQITEEEFNNVFWNLKGNHERIAKYFNIYETYVRKLRRRLEYKGTLRKNLAIIEPNFSLA